eukprot:TRINITY_DN68893_c0_g1_i1.p1 TRINITY_DN68893_c0_g1~~TRINITY_DN68893_c0_g1_i1.p1  ORF type:complete len:554 (+),score=173.04 TRINITY_DN68893_c0_g1_i1:288-1949(+)
MAFLQAGSDASPMLLSPVGQIFHNTSLDIANEPDTCRLNKIICTIGPKTQTVEMLMQLIEAGMSIVRLNFSHGTHEFHKRTIDNAREACKRLGRDDVAIALDTKGPEIRTGEVPAGPVQIKKGQTFTLTTDPAEKAKGDADHIFIDYKNIGGVIRAGNHVFIDDGALDLLVTSVQKRGEFFEVITTAQNSSALSTFKGVNLPNVEVDLPAVSPKDAEDLAFAVSTGCDMVFASFMQSADSVRQVRDVLVRASPADDPNAGKRVKIISKVENDAGVTNFDGVLNESDGIMVARGDLGIEIPLEKVFVAQKMMISRSNLAGKPVICATQMLESMTTNPRPTRAEVSDVANAVLDGADCVMLSGETAKGDYPVETVRTMARVCREAQACTQAKGHFEALRAALKPPVSTEVSVAMTAVASAYETRAAAIVVLSNSGGTARAVAKFFPAVPIICPTEIASTCRSLALTRAVLPILTAVPDKTSPWARREYRVAGGILAAVDRKIARAGDRVVVVHADPDTRGFANQLRILLVPPREEIVKAMESGMWDHASPSPTTK